MDDYCYECTGYGDNYYYDEELDDYVCACDDCPYNDNNWEKQAPKKPIDNIEREWFECPTCGRVIVTYYAGERHHCKCGQALNWEGIK